MVGISEVEGCWRILELFSLLFRFFPTTKPCTWRTENNLKVRIAILNSQQSLWPLWLYYSMYTSTQHPYPHPTPLPFTGSPWSLIMPLGVKSLPLSTGLCRERTRLNELSVSVFNSNTCALKWTWWIFYSSSKIWRKVWRIFVHSGIVSCWNVSLRSKRIAIDAESVMQICSLILTSIEW